MPEWFEDESFWIELYQHMFSEKRYAAASEEVEKILMLSGIEAKSVLDLCCGPGRHAVAFAKKGIRVTGVDRTPFLLSKAKELAKAEEVEIEWILEDMRNFERPDAFDLVINMFTAFGYFDKKEEDVAVLRNIYASLKQDGCFVIDMMGKEKLARIFEPATVSKEDDGALLVQLHEIFDDWSRIRNEWILIKDGKAKSFKFHHTIYSGQELKDLMHQVGFRDIKLYGNLDGERYGPDAVRLIAVGCK